MKQESYEDALKRALSEDPIVDSVAKRWLERSEVGIKKYGTTLEKNNLGSIDWINHTIEELMDAINYLEKLKRVIIKHG